MPLHIRVATPQDASGILAIYSPFCSSSHVSFEIAPPSHEQMCERIESVLARYPWLVAEIDGRVAGYVYASQHGERAAYRWGVDVAIYLAESQRRRGLGRSLYAAFFPILRAQRFFQAYASITLPNAGSVGLHESLGFNQVAVFPSAGYKLGRWLDVGWWRLQLAESIDDPPNPIWFEDFRLQPAFAAVLAGGTQHA